MARCLPAAAVSLASQHMTYDLLATFIICETSLCFMRVCSLAGGLVPTFAGYLLLASCCLLLAEDVDVLVGVMQAIQDEYHN